ncbi:MAG TPA: NAD(P)H-quinone oxidoreductase [Thermoanaerobaculia bacterium]|jgi:putative PIG3 family NAD(P)H quinone oxidoreductase|nr:NAD(P)H-quinone oxidoreductase [Thermoanaerobaculia bacterium]
MLAVAPYLPGSDGVPRRVELPDPVPAAGEVLVAVAATALNHADLHQLQGTYPPPPGESEVPGLELAGTVEALGFGVDLEGPWRVGTRVMALVAGGGHGERAAVPVGQLMPVPENLTLLEAAAIPEAALTAWTNLVVEGKLHPGETVVVTGATGGMGSFAAQLARELGGRVVAVGRDPERLARLRALDLGIETVSIDDELAATVRELSGNRGADLMLDFVAGPRFGERVNLLRKRGRVVLVGVTAGPRVQLDLSVVLSRRLRLVGSTLRPRSREEKTQLVAGFAEFALPRLADGRLRPVIDRVLPFSAIADGYAALETGGVLGKIVIEMRRSDG